MHNVQVNVVSVDAGVPDRLGNPVMNPTESDFVVKEDGVAMPITNFARLRDRRVNIAVVLDTSRGSLDQPDLAKQFIFRLLYELDHKDKI